MKSELPNEEIDQRAIAMAERITPVYYKWQQDLIEFKLSQADALALASGIISLAAAQTSAPLQVIMTAVEASVKVRVNELREKIEQIQSSN